MHLFEARDSGLTEEEIGRIAFGPDAPFWAPLDQAIIRAVDELVDDGGITEATWAVLAEELDEQQLLDLIFTVGCLRDHLVAGQLGRVRGRSRGPRDVRALPAATGRSPVKPAPFEYHAPSSVDEAVGAARRARRRRQGPGRRPEPRADARPAPGALRAPRRHRPGRRAAGHRASQRHRCGSARARPQADDRARRRRSPAAVPLLGRATPLIGHFQIRNRGTIGGSLAHADPAAEYPAVALALDAEFEAQSPRGPRAPSRRREFFTGMWSTALAEDELLTGVALPGLERALRVRRRGVRPAPRRLRHRRRGRSPSSSTTTTASRRCAIGLLGIGSTPERAPAAEAARHRSPPSTTSTPARSGRRRCRGLDAVPSDLHGSAAYRTAGRRGDGGPSLDAAPSRRRVDGMTTEVDGHGERRRPPGHRRAAQDAGRLPARATAASPAPTSAASTACAAPARCSRRRRRALVPRVRRAGRRRRGHHDRGPGAADGELSTGAGGVPRLPRPAVRVLHARASSCR